jgi:hypothetical protein
LLLVSAQIQNAAKEGAHYASLHPCERAEDIRTNAIEPRLTLVDSSFTVSRTLATEAPRSTLQMGSPITITLLYTWTSYVNIMPDMSTLTLRPLGPLVLHGQGVDLIENPGTLAIPCP